MTIPHVLERHFGPRGRGAGTGPGVLYESVGSDGSRGEISMIEAWPIRTHVRTRVWVQAGADGLQGIVFIYLPGTGRGVPALPYI